MKEITEAEADKWLENGAGLICELGGIGTDQPIVVVQGEGHLEDRWFLATQEDLEHSKDGVFVQLKHPENPPLPEFDDVFTVVEL